MKDNFSKQAEQYAIYRPSYPDELLNRIYSLVNDFDTAWDCATGNGQLATALSSKFTQVIATDISSKQLEKAVQKNNISYSLGRAEKTDFKNESFDLITVGQAVHWFDFDKFYPEVKRVLKPKGILAVLGYNLVKTTPEIDKVIDQLYSRSLKDFWDPERTYIDHEFRNLPFQMDNVHRFEENYELEWEFEHLLGYLNTWSAVQHYKDRIGENIVDHYSDILYYAWGNDKKRLVSFPFFALIGSK
jgi:SAM-dependent methyltransferase